MSVQFGRWNFEGQPAAPEYIEKVNATLAPYGPDSNESYLKGGVNILYRAFRTTKESRHETQPRSSPLGAVISWDGRLDNRAELIEELHNALTICSTDLEIVAAAYEKWGTRCLAKLIGDWALSIWNPTHRSLILAKDPIGTRHLYYSFDNNQVTWSTILDPLVLFAGKTFEICEEYIAGWFATRFPAAHLTPYVNIHAVPPSSCVLLRPGKHIVSKYWNFDSAKRIRYRTDAEYEEQFRTALALSVKRRLRSDRPVLGELSGGIDSSSIVCMADLVIAHGEADCPRLDTITWYDESKPNWGELPHFTRVEEKRGRVGHHIDAGSLEENNLPTSFGCEFAIDRFAATPFPNNVPSRLFEQQAQYMLSQGYRVTLSGIGGGEVTGDGVPTPTPELQNLLARARFLTLARQVNAWAAKMRQRRFPLLWKAVRGFSPLPFLDIPEYVTPVAPWFHPDFVRRNRAALRDYPFRVNLFGPLPSLQHNLLTLDADRRVLAYLPLEPQMLREVRLPYLDRNLLEFMYAIPREQIVRVGQRRSLMRRALVGIVPDELLNRKKRASVPPPVKGRSPNLPSWAEIGQYMISSSVGIMNSDRFLEALQKARRKEDVPIESLMRTLELECWMRQLAIRGVLASPMSTETQQRSPFCESEKLQGPVQPTRSAN